MCAASKTNLDLQRDRNSRQHYIEIFELSSLKCLCATAPTSLPCCPWSAEAWLWMCVVQPQPTLAEHRGDKFVDMIWYKICYVTLLAWERQGLYQAEDVPGTCIRNGWQRNITLWMYVFMWHVRSLRFVPWCLIIAGAHSDFINLRKSLMLLLHVIVPAPVSYFALCCAISVIMEQYLYTQF